MISWIMKRLAPKPVVLREKEARLIADLLFPNPDIQIEPQSGEVYQVDYSADMNLDSALIDLRDGRNDKTVHTTIQDVLERLYQVRSILQVSYDIDPRAQMIIVDVPPKPEDPNA